MANQQIDGEYIKTGSIPVDRLEGGTSVPMNSVGAAEIDGADAVAIRAEIGVDPAQAKGADVPSTATLLLSAFTADFFDVTGTTTVTAISLAAGREAVLRFTGALTVTYNASTLILPGAVNFVTVAGDVLIFRGTSTGVVCVGVVRAAGAYKFAKAYESSANVITAAGGLSLTHGLGAAPSLLQATLVCVADEAGYTAGQVVCVPIGQVATDRGAGAHLTSTQIVMRFGSDANTFSILHATTGVTTALTNAKWNIVVRAWL